MIISRLMYKKENLLIVSNFSQLFGVHLYSMMKLSTNNNEIAHNIMDIIIFYDLIVAISYWIFLSPALWPFDKFLKMNEMFSSKQTNKIKKMSIISKLYGKFQCFDDNDIQGKIIEYSFNIKIKKNSFPLIVPRIHLIWKLLTQIINCLTMHLMLRILLYK